MPSPPRRRPAPASAAPNSTPEGAEQGGLRLNRALAMAGVCSRRAADELIREGRVRVGGAVVHDLGRRVVPGREEIVVDGKRVELAPEGATTLVIALNKPRGVISTMHDPHGAPTVAELIPARLGRLYPVGRLDRDSQGLLLMTNDGDLTHRLLHPSFEVPKVYHVTVDRPIAPPHLRLLVEGRVEMPGDEPPLPWEIDPIERSRFGHPRYRCVLREGKKREIREVLDTLGYEVKRLKRVAIGPIDLGDPKIGEWRLLSDKELSLLRAAVGLKTGDTPKRRQPPPSRPPASPRREPAAAVARAAERPARTRPGAGRPARPSAAPRGKGDPAEARSPRRGEGRGAPPPRRPGAPAEREGGPRRPRPKRG